MSLQKPLLALLILTIASSVFSTTCGDNPLLGFYGITPAFSDAQIVPDLKYCKSLQNTETCCDAATINNFQAKTDDLLSTLSADVAKRDQLLIRIRTYLLPSLSSQLKTLIDLADQAAIKLQAKLDAGGYGNSTFDLRVSRAISFASNLSETFESLTDGISTLKSSFPLYQEARAVCVIETVKIQAAAWCLACDPEYASKGVSIYGIALSDTLVQSLTSFCYDYFTGSLSQSAIFSLNLMNDYLANFTSAFTEIVNDDDNISGPIEYLGAIKRMENSRDTFDPIALPVQLPNGCDVTGCNWIDTTLFKFAQLNEILLAIGGDLESDNVFNRRLEEVKVNNRMLGASWSPDHDEAGVSVTFSNNPGNVDNNSAALFKGIMGGLVVLFSVLFI